MKLDELVARIEEVEEEIQHEKKVEVEDLVNLSPYLTLENPLTYLVYLDLRKDLDDDTKELYKRYGKLLAQKEQQAYAKAALQMFDIRPEGLIQGDVQPIN